MKGRHSSRLRLRRFLLLSIFGVKLICLGQNAAAQPTLSESAISLPADIQKIYSEALRYEQNQDLPKAKALYQKILNDFSNRQGLDLVQKSLERVNLNIILLDVPIAERQLYTVKKHDTIGTIAQRYHTTTAVIQSRNHLQDNLIYPGQTLSLWVGQLSIHISKSENKLFLKNRDEVLKIYPVSTGKEGSTPTGVFTIATKMVDPVWFHHGVVVPPGTPKNFLGTRWMGFNIPKYGIHGTVEPQFIGQAVSSGCVRMRNEDVEELYKIVPKGTKVEIVDH